MSRLELKLRTYMQICKDLAALSHDTKCAVAAVAITDDFREISAIGYNGDFTGGPNERTDFSHGRSGFLHAEENVLFHLGKPFELRDSLIMLCTHKPCTMCAKRICGSGIRRVIYETDYVDELGRTDEIFRSTGVRCVSLDGLLASADPGRFLTDRGPAR